MKRLYSRALTVLLLASVLLASACGTGKSGGTASPEFTALVNSAAETGGRFSQSSAALANSYSLYIAAGTPKTPADVEAIIGILETLQKDLGSYGKDAEAAVKLVRQLAAEQEKTARALPDWQRSVIHTAYAQGADDAIGLAVEANKNQLTSQQVEACYKQWHAAYSLDAKVMAMEARTSGTDSKLVAEARAKLKLCDSMQLTLDEQMRKATGFVASTTVGAFVAAGAGKAVAAGAFGFVGATGAVTLAGVAGGALVIVGAGYAASHVAGVMYDYCFPAKSGGQKLVLQQQQCSIVAGQATTGTRLALPPGKGTLTLFSDGTAPLIIRDVSINEGEDTTIEGSPVPLDDATPGDLSSAAKNVKQTSGPPTIAAAPTATPAPSDKTCWKRSPVDSASSAAASGIFTFKFTDASFEIKDSGQPFKSAKASRTEAVSGTTGILLWSLPERICPGDDVSFAIKQTGKFATYPYPSLGDADRYASAQALLDGVARGDRFAASGSTSQTVGPFTANAWAITPPTEHRAFKVALLLSGSGGTYSAATLWTYTPE